MTSRGYSALRGRWPAATRAVCTVRAALMQLTRRLAEAGAADESAPPPTNTMPTAGFRDEYRVGFSLSRPPPANDFRECPWCRSLANPEAPDGAELTGDR